MFIFRVHAQEIEDDNQYTLEQMETKPVENYVKDFSAFFQLHFLLFINASEECGGGSADNNDIK